MTGALSVFCFILALTILCAVRKKVKSDRTYMQLNLVTTLLFFHITSLLHNVAVQYPRTCYVAAVALHFFTLASGKMKKIIELELKRIFNTSRQKTTKSQLGLQNSLVAWVSGRVARASATETVTWVPLPVRSNQRLIIIGIHGFPA